MSKSKKNSSILFLVLAFGVFFIFNSHEVTGAAKQSVTVAKVKNAPAGLDDPAWQKAKLLTFTLRVKRDSLGKRLPSLPRLSTRIRKSIFCFPGKMRPGV